MADYLNANHILVYMTSAMQEGDFINEPENVKELREKFDQETNTRKRSQITDEWVNSVMGIPPIKEYVDLFYLGIKKIATRYRFDQSLDPNDIATDAYLRIKKYNSFKPYKDGKRVSAFAYITQVVKNIEYAMLNDRKQFVALDQVSEISSCDIEINNNLHNESIW